MLLVFAGVCCFPLALMLHHAAGAGEAYSGVGGGLDLGDQYRYLAWIRDAAGNGLIGGVAGPGATAHAYFSPLFLISGLLLLAGVAIQVANQLWLPVAIVAVFAGYRAFVWRMLPPGGGRPAALALALMGSSPLLPLLDYGHITDANQNWGMITLATHLAPYWQASGYFPIALALALVPVYVLGIRNALDGAAPRPAVIAAAGFTVALLSPPAGLMLALLTALFMWRNPRALAVPLVALLVPLIYYLVLSEVSADWSLGGLRNSFTLASTWTFLAVFGPVLVVAAYARPRNRDPTDALLWCWLAASALVFAVLRAPDRLWALDGTSVPLAILAVKAWQRRHWPSSVSGVALLLAIVPGAVYAAHTFRDYLNDDYGPFALKQGEVAALRALPRGHVLATPYLSAAVPVFGGRSTTSPPLLVRVPVLSPAALDRLFDGRLNVATARPLVDSSGATAVLSDCRPGRAPLAPVLKPRGFTERRFGCAAVWVRS